MRRWLASAEGAEQQHYGDHAAANDQGIELHPACLKGLEPLAATEGQQAGEVDDAVDHLESTCSTWRASLGLPYTKILPLMSLRKHLLARKRYTAGKRAATAVPRPTLGR